jgi:hypothetical protein
MTVLFFPTTEQTCYCLCKICFSIRVKINFSLDVTKYFSLNNLMQQATKRIWEYVKSNDLPRDSKVNIV